MAAAANLNSSFAGDFDSSSAQRCNLLECFLNDTGSKCLLT